MRKDNSGNIALATMIGVILAFLFLKFFNGHIDNIFDAIRNSIK